MKYEGVLRIQIVAAFWEKKTKTFNLQLSNSYFSPIREGMTPENCINIAGVRYSSSPEPLCVTSSQEPYHQE